MLFGNLLVIGFYVVLVGSITQFGMSLTGGIVLHYLHHRIPNYNADRFTEYFIPMAIGIVISIASLICNVLIKYNGVLIVSDVLIIMLMFMTVNIFFTGLMVTRILKYIHYLEDNRE